MTCLRHALCSSKQVLKKHGIEDSDTEARAILQFVTGLSAAELYAQPERRLTDEEQKQLEQLLKRRLSREPLAYLTNKKEFYGLEFYVNRHVLIPRPETELLVETAIALANRATDGTYAPIIADVGTGCGAIAISLAVNLPACRFYATDISPHALDVARTNAERHNVRHRITFLEGNLLQPLPEPVDIIVANLPYVSYAELRKLPPEIRNFEPEIALNGGKNGLELIGQLMLQVESKIKPAGHLLLEIGQGHGEKLASLVRSSLRSAELSFLADLNGVKRVARISFPER